MTGDLVAQLFTDLKGAPPIQVYIIIKYGNKMFFSYKQWNPVNYRHFWTWRKKKKLLRKITGTWQWKKWGGGPCLTFLFFLFLWNQLFPHLYPDNIQQKFENYTLIPENLQQRIIYRVIYNIALYNAMIYGILYFYSFQFSQRIM